MESTFRCRIAAITAGAVFAGSFAASVPALASIFGQKEVDQSRFVAIAAPRGSSAHQLLIVEQVSDNRPCWSESGSAPVQIDPLLVNFDFTGICGRSTDSNGYSIRVNGEDLGLQYSLRVVNQDNDLVLIGAPSNLRGESIEIARANGYTSEFAKLSLNSGWRFTKRTYDNRTLGHVYLTYEGDGPVTGQPPISQPPPVSQPPTDEPPIAVTPPGSGNETPSFRDIANDIYAKEIEEAVALGFIAGFQEDNTFRPQVALTREQIVSMVLEALNSLPDVNLSIPGQTNSSPFRDVPASRWSAAKIQFAQTHGIVSGYSDGSFRPSQPVTRAELMAVLRRAAEYGKTRQGQAADLERTQQRFPFTDTAGHWGESLIRQMSRYCGVASPVNEAGTEFQPDSAAKRNYAAAATLRMMKCLGEEQE